LCLASPLPIHHHVAIDPLLPTESPLPPQVKPGADRGGAAHIGPPTLPPMTESDQRLPLPRSSVGFQAEGWLPLPPGGEALPPPPLVLCPPCRALVVRRR
jgi:hypothetical protein